MLDIDRDISLIKYLPKYYEENKEIKNITGPQSTEINQLWENISIILNNQFITNADELTIKKWEKLLSLKPNLRTDSLERRKAVVLLNIATKPPITHKWLEDKLKETAGKDNYKIESDYSNYSIYLRIKNNSGSIPISELVNYLRHIIPANVAMELTEEIQTNTSKQILYTGSYLCLQRSYITIPTESEIIKDLNFNNSAYTGTFMSEISSFLIPTCKLKEEL